MGGEKDRGKNMGGNTWLKASASSSTDVRVARVQVSGQPWNSRVGLGGFVVPGQQERPLEVAAAGNSSHPGLEKTDRQYLTIVLVLQLLHVSPPNSQSQDVSLSPGVSLL